MSCTIDTTGAVYSGQKIILIFSFPSRFIVIAENKISILVITA